MPSVCVIGTRGYPSYYGGFETAVRHLAPYLSARGWDVSVYGRGTSQSKLLTKGDRAVTSINTPGFESKSLSTLSYGLTSTMHAATKKPDVALVMNVANGFWLPLLRARNIPSVVNVDGLEWTREKWGRLARGVFYSGARMTAKFGDSLIFDAKAIGEYWSDTFKRQGTWIPYGGVDSPGRQFAEGFAAGRYVLAVARLVPENTIPEFLKAAENLARQTPVVLVGSSGYGSELDERARHLSETNSNFHWLGHVHDDDRLFSLWKNAAVYFHGHSVGGTNPALVQAMMLGAPTVARDTVFNREVLGGAAFFTAPSPESIETSINELLADPAKQDHFSREARMRAEELYTWERVNSAYENTLSDAVERAKTGRKFIG